MPRFVKDGLTIVTAVATEAAELRRDGFVEQKAVAPKPAPKTESK